MKDITLCHPRLQVFAERLVETCSQQGLPISIGETLRTVAEQDALYAQGRTRPGQIVTNARGSSYSSYHQWGTAFDFFRNDGRGAYNEVDRFFDKVGAIGTDIGLEWGGNWKSFKDKPHFQLSDWGSSTSGIKKIYANPDEFRKTWGQVEEKKGWVRNATGWWYRNEDGTYLANQWQLIGRHWYLFNKDGYRCTGWHRWNGTITDPEDGSGDWYFFDNTVDGMQEGACWHTRENGAQEVWYVDNP